VRRKTAKARATSDPDFGPWLARASILVVDDEPGMRNFLMRTLGPRCKLLEEAVDTDEASRKLDRQHFDVVVLDNVMPGKNGVEWLAEQRAIGFFSAAILLTAYADLETAIRALRAGAVDFVLKPFRSNQILNAVARCLDRTRLQREYYVLRYELRSTSDHASGSSSTRWRRRRRGWATSCSSWRSSGSSCRCTAAGSRPCPRTSPTSSGPSSSARSTAGC
jgi:DNA-binding NtrC family response regulator